MSLNVKDVLQAPILYFDTIGSTNNHAAQLIDADKAQNGLTLVTKEQTAGRGQRGKVWYDKPAESLLMSIVLQPKATIEHQFGFSAAVAVAIATALKELDETFDIHIKFPNDIIINDKKAVGILIENSLRGSIWTHAIIGLGINVYQKSFPKELPHAISLTMASEKAWDLGVVLSQVRAAIVAHTHLDTTDDAITRYNELLYKKGSMQIFLIGDAYVEAKILGVSAQGALLLELSDGRTESYQHGSFSWVW